MKTRDQLAFEQICADLFTLVQEAANQKEPILRNTAQIEGVRKLWEIISFADKEGMVSSVYYNRTLVNGKPHKHIERYSVEAVAGFLYDLRNSVMLGPVAEGANILIDEVADQINMRAPDYLFPQVKIGSGYGLDTSKKKGALVHLAQLVYFQQKFFGLRTFGDACAIYLRRDEKSFRATISNHLTSLAKISGPAKHAAYCAKHGIGMSKESLAIQARVKEMLGGTTSLTDASVPLPQPLENLIELAFRPEQNSTE